MSCNHEWGGVVIPGPVNRVVIDQCENCGELRLPDAAPPALGIDLGQFREAITREYANSRALCDMPRILECERLLALIDGRDAGAGVDRGSN